MFKNVIRNSKWYENNGWERREVNIPDDDKEAAVNFLNNLNEWAEEQGFLEVCATIEGHENPKDTIVVWGKRESGVVWGKEEGEERRYWQWYRENGWEVIDTDNMAKIQVGDIQNTIDYFTNIKEKARKEGFKEVDIEMQCFDRRKTEYVLWGKK